MSYIMYHVNSLKTILKSDHIRFFLLLFFFARILKIVSWTFAVSELQLLFFSMIFFHPVAVEFKVHSAAKMTVNTLRGGSGLT